MAQESITFHGDLTVDRYIREGTERLGGSSFNAAVWAGRQGARVSVLAAVGTDEPGERFLAACTEHSIDASHVKVLDGDTSVVSIDTGTAGERVFVGWDSGVLGKFQYGADDFAFIETHDALVVSVYDRTRGIIDQIRNQYREHPEGKPICVADFGDLSMFDKNPVVIEDYMDVFDIIVLGLDRTQDNAIIQALRKYAQSSSVLFLVTLGNEGGIAFLGNKEFQYDSIETTIVDTTGAGDSFLAGFLVSYLRSRDISNSLDTGALLASRVVGMLGAS